MEQITLNIEAKDKIQFIMDYATLHNISRGEDETMEAFIERLKPGAKVFASEKINLMLASICAEAKRKKRINNTTTKKTLAVNIQ